MGAIIPYKDLEAMAQQVVRSKMFPGINTNEAAVTLFLLCQSEGLHPMQALTRYNVIAGRLAMKADAMLAEFMRRGGTVKWIEWTNEACEAEFKSTGCPDGVKVRWTMEDAQRAGVAQRNPNYKTYPRQMLKARVASDGVRMADPAVNQGRHTPEEIQDFAPDGQAVLADAEVVGTEPDSAASIGVANEKAPPTAPQSASGLTNEEYLAESRKRSAEALEKYGPDSKLEKKLEESIEHVKDMKKALKRPTWVPDKCDHCGDAIFEYEASEGGGLYFECKSRHDDRHDMADQGVVKEDIKRHTAPHYFKWASKK